MPSQPSSTAAAHTSPGAPPATSAAPAPPEGNGQHHLLGIAAHELRDPLSLVYSTSVFLRDHLSDVSQDELREHLDFIANTSTEMLGKVSRFLEASKLSQETPDLHPTRVQVQALVDDTIRAFAPAITDKGMTVTTEGSPDLTLRADAELLQQALHNLLSNAVKFSHPEQTIRICWTTTDRATRLAVQDEGQGIPPEEHERLFKPFGTTSVQGTANEDSTGMGLYIVRRVAEAHGGTVEVESTPGRGARFTLLLPHAVSES